MSGGDVAATARLEIRVDANGMARLETAAELLKIPLSDFVRTAAVERAVRVLREHEAQTTVPAIFFEDLLDALDRPASRRPHLLAPPSAPVASSLAADRQPMGVCGGSEPDLERGHDAPSLTARTWSVKTSPQSDLHLAA